MTGVIARRTEGVLRRFCRARTGTAAIEFAMIALPFFMLLLVIFETAIMFFAEYVMETGLAKAARMIRTGQVQEQNLSKAEFKDLICGDLKVLLDCDGKLHVDVRSFQAFSDIAGSIPPTSKDGELNPEVVADADGDGFKPGAAMEVVVARAFYDWDLIVPQFSRLGNLNGNRRLLIVGMTFRNEPFN